MSPGMRSTGVRRGKSGASRQAPESPPRHSPKSGSVQSGAVQRKTRFSDVSKAYWGHHRASATGSLNRLLAQPMQTLMTALVVAIALALPATLLVGLNNIHQLGENWDASPRISLYLDARAQGLAIDELRQRLSAMPEIAELTYVSPEQAIQDLRATSGFAVALDALDENPLPPSMIIAPGASTRQPAQIKLLAEQLAQEPLVDEVSLDMEWVKRLRELMVLGQRIVYALAALLALGLLVAIGNTIRLAIENRRDEIVVTKLVGGTDGFVRRPFLYTGGWYGFMGGILACVLVAFGYWAISGSVARLAASYQSDYQLAGLGFAGNVALVALSTLIGWLGAWLAVSRHLSQIEPK